MKDAIHQAIIMGNIFASYCTEGFCGRIHSVFDRAVNIEVNQYNSYVSLLTLLCDISNITPTALITSMHGGSWHDICKIGDNVIFTPDIIYLNSIPLVNKVSTANIWKPIESANLIGLPQFTYKEMVQRCKQVDLYIEKQNVRINLFPDMHMSNFDVTKLLGLGDGLTPSGDDFLAGVLFAIHFAQMIYKKQFIYLPSIAKSVLQNMTERTNQISQHFLSCASHGLWGRATEQFILALFGSDNEALFSAIQKKISYGATSGMDEMRGIMFGLCETIKVFEEELLCI